MRDWKEYVRSRLPRMRVRPEREIEIVEELAAQLEQTYQEARRAGDDDPEAAKKAMAQMPDGDRLALEIETSVAPPHRDRARIWDGIPLDIRHALRSLGKSPLFTAAAMLTLAIGVGGCTAMFSLIEAVVLRPIGYPDAHQLVMVWEHQYRRGYQKNVVAMADYLDWKARNHVFSDMSFILDQTWNATGDGPPQVLKGVAVTERFLPMLGVPPLIGRGFSADETKPDGPSVAIISHRLWVERFGASKDAVGRTFLLDDKPWTVIGVLPAGFPWLGRPLDILTPAQFRNRDWRVRAGRFLRVTARLKPGVSIQQAQDELSAIAKQLETEYPQFNKDWGVQIVPLAEHFQADTGTALWVLMGAVSLVLLIACSNVANLMLARAVTRERELAIRAALGGTRFRMMRLVMIESLMLAIAGGLLGCACAYGSVHLIQAYGPQNVARLNSAGINVMVLLFALLVSAATGIAFGLAPAAAAGRLQLAGALKDGARGTLNTVRGEWLRGAFVVAQVGMAMVLLTGAGLLIQSLYRLNAVPTGFDPKNVLTATVSLSGNIQQSKPPATFARMIEQIRAIPGVENAGFTTFLPFAGMGAATGFSVQGRPPYGPGQTPVTDVRVVQPGYFETMRIPLLRGRQFTAVDDREDSQRVFVVNETLVRQTFGTADPIGENLIVQMGDDKPGRIVGVVRDTKHGSLSAEIRPMVYYDHAQFPMAFGTFVARTRLRPEALTQDVVAAIQKVKKDQPVTEIRSMEDWIGLSVARMRFQTGLLAAFAAIAIVLALIGVYGVMAYAVAQRTHEIGIRLALGADPVRVKRWITGRGIRLAGVGLSLGSVAAWAATRVLQTLLFEVKPHDPATFAVAGVLLAAACVAASYIPARRATRVDPAVALRGE